MSHHLNDEQLIGYIHFTLTDAERETMDEHLKACPECRTRMTEVEVLQRRIRYSLAADMKAVAPPSTMTFDAIASRLEHRRWRYRFRVPSSQFLPGAATLAALAGLAVALVGLFRGAGWSSGNGMAAPRSSLPMLASGCFAVTVVGNYKQRTWPARLTLSRALALTLWAGTAIVGLQVIVVVVDVLVGLSFRGLAANFAILSIWPLAVGWIALVVGGGEYHYKRVGQRSSWRLFGWSVAVELLILVLCYLLSRVFSLPHVLS